MAIQNDYSNYNNYAPAPQDQVSQSWSLQGLYQYFMNWFQATPPSAYTDPSSQSSYDLGMQDQWNSLYQPLDPEAAMQGQLDMQITIKQEQMSQFETELASIDNDPQAKAAIDGVRRNLTDPQQKSYGGGGLGMFFNGGYVTTDTQDKFSDLIEKYKYVLKDKITLNADGQPNPAEFGKALYYIHDFIQSRKNEAQADRDSLVGQRDGTIEIDDEDEPLYD